MSVGGALRADRLAMGSRCGYERRDGPARARVKKRAAIRVARAIYTCRMHTWSDVDAQKQAKGWLCIL